MQVADFAEGTSLLDQPVRAFDVKRRLQSVCGQPRFKQRLLLDGQILSDDALLEGPLDLQLVLLDFRPSSDDQIKRLLSAARLNNTAIMEHLLHRPQDPDAEFGGSSALHFACSQGHMEAVQLLLEASADKDKADEGGATPMFVASWVGHMEVVRWLLQVRADKDKCDNNGATPLLKACGHHRYDHVEVVRLLLESNADTERATVLGNTPLLAASQNGHVEIVRILLEAKADKDKARTDGSSPMLVAYGHLEVVQLLLKARADKDKANIYGWTPMSRASDSGRSAVVRLLQDASPKGSRPKTEGWKSNCWCCFCWSNP